MSSRVYNKGEINTAAQKSIRKYRNKQHPGALPNVRWRAITDAVLELHPRFVALPDPTEITFQSFADLTKFRQSSWQSQELHKCRVTTRHLIDALGLSSSPRLAQGLSISKRGTGPDATKHVRKHLAGQRPTSYSYLCQTTMITRDIVLRDFTSKDTVPNSARWTFESQEHAHPKQPKYSVLSSHAEPLLGVQICFGQPVVGERLIVYANSAETQVKYWKLQSDSTCHSTDEYYLIGCGRSTNFCAGVSGMSAPGELAEGAQVIMFEEDQSTMSTATAKAFRQKTTWQYNQKNGTLQHVHSKRFLCIDVQVRHPVNDPPAWTAVPSSATQEIEAQGLTSWTHALRPKLPESITRSKDRTIPTSFRHAKDVAMAWGGVQEATAVLALMNEFPKATAHEIGCALLESSSARIPAAWGIDIGDLPLIGASPDAVLVRADGTKEVVEIKNVCPFVDARGSKKGLFDIGNNKTPPVQIPASHMPQIQMEMFCTDTQVNNYVVASTFHGVHMFRVQRNDEYIRLMLELLRNLELEVVRKMVPGKNIDVSFFERDSRYEKLRTLSIQLVQKSPLWRQVFPTRVQRGDEASMWVK